MPRCGDCKNIIIQSSNSAAREGYCNAQLDECGLGKEVTIYLDAGKCPYFVAQERIRTEVSEFMWDQSLRVARGFEEK
ncbi:MAG: hypothetical protein C4589_10360 [Peptococcaceae bacterium]|nr:MAG: hypothetical protein C4589_10360 [Peptococcaceae bacterium]